MPFVLHFGDWMDGGLVVTYLWLKFSISHAMVGTFALHMAIFSNVYLLRQFVDFFHETGIHNICDMHILLQNMHIFLISWGLFNLNHDHWLFGSWQFWRKRKMVVFKIFDSFSKSNIFRYQMLNLGLIWLKFLLKDRFLVIMSSYGAVICQNRFWHFGNCRRFFKLFLSVFKFESNFFFFLVQFF